MSSTSALFSAIKVGNMNLRHRIVLAPMSRLRVHTDHTPGPYASLYYSQRGSAPGTLLITEATIIAQKAGGIDFLPGIYTDVHVEAWKKVTEAVHEKGSFIFLQLSALGRLANPDILARENNPYVSALAIHDPKAPDSVTPRELTIDEIKEYVSTYSTVAKVAIEAGFDGVEVHGAYGNLVEQFIQDGTNQRTDQYGGSVENRARFALEVVDAIVEAVGAERTAIRLSPWYHSRLIGMKDLVPQYSYLVEQLHKHKLAYIQVLEPTAGNKDDFLRKIWEKREGSTYISNGGHTRQSAIETADNKGGLVAFARNFITNPDLPSRLLKDITLVDPKPHKATTWYQKGTLGNLTEKGYTDWPFASENAEQKMNTFSDIE